MPLPCWKIWLSYLTELHIESTSSEYNPHLYVSLYKGRYQLSTANAVYSFGDLYTNFSRTFDQWNWEKFPPNQVLLLGLGLGSIPVILETLHQQPCQFTAVEIDEEVVDLAYRYVLEGLESPIEMITADAALVVQQLTPASFDLICVDIFDDDVVPAAFEETAFLEQATSLLRKGGVLLFNRLAANTADQEKSTAFYENTFRRVFPGSCCLDVGGNFMLVSNRHAILREDT
ncbi:MAG: fused MFS/spermidine synthase [Bacteroidota bacterium]